MAHIYTSNLDGNCDCVAIEIDTAEGERTAREWVRDYGGEWAPIYVGEPGTPDAHKTGGRLFAAARS